MPVLETNDNNLQGPAGAGNVTTPDQTSGKLSKDARDGVPTFGAGYGIYETRPENFILSFLTHVAIVALAVWLLHATIQKIKPAVSTEVTPLVGPYLPLTPSRKAGGGGGGGENSKLLTSAGAPPKTSKAQQFAPPVVIRPKEESKIMREPTVVADLKFSAPPQIGDLKSLMTAPSNGTGTGSGVGTGSGGGYGSGHGKGYGPGSGYGSGGGDGGFGGVTPPKILYQTDPEFSEEARKKKYQGVVVLKVVVGADGRVHNPQVARSLGMGLDEKALESIKSWRFEPARAKDGRAVDAIASIEVNFRLY